VKGGKPGYLVNKVSATQAS